MRVADLFAHAPLADGDRETLANFAQTARQDRTCRFDAGHRPATWGIEAGYEITEDTDLRDGELCTQGPCSDDVLRAWANRLARMPRLREAAAPGFENRSSPASRAPGHVGGTRVRCIVARRRER